MQSTIVNPHCDYQLGSVERSPILRGEYILQFESSWIVKNFSLHPDAKEASSKPQAHP